MLRFLPRVATARAPVAMAGLRGIKTTTGIVGLPVEPNAKAFLISLYSQTLDALEPVPPSSEYRKSVEALVKERLAVVESEDELAAIEAKIGGGQVEQLIEQAKDELKLIPTLIAARAFDPYDGTAPEEILIDLKRRGIALQRDDIPMRPSVDFPTETEVELELPAIEEKE